MRHQPEELHGLQYSQNAIVTRTRNPSSTSCSLHWPLHFLLLHKLGHYWIGRNLGILGTCLLLISFVYSLRKRQIIKFGFPKELLNAHEYLSWAGVLMILVHAGWHLNAVLPWLAVFLMSVVEHWRHFHLPLTAVFTALAIVHIVSILVLWKW